MTQQLDSFCPDRKKATHVSGFFEFLLLPANYP